MWSDAGEKNILYLHMWSFVTFNTSKWHMLTISQFESEHKQNKISKIDCKRKKLTEMRWSIFINNK